MNRILVIRGGAIGDFVLTLPAIKLLRVRFPAAHIEILGNEKIARLADKRFYADAVRSLESAGLARFFAKDSELPSDWLDYFSGFDLIISYLFDPDRSFETNLKRANARRIIAGPAKLDGSEHAARQLARPLEALGLNLSDPAAEIYPSAEDRAAAISSFGDLAPKSVLFHPGSGSETKNWPIEHWQRFGDLLLATGWRLVVISGEAEEERTRVLESAWSGRPARFAKNLPLPSLAALLERALFVGHDSGISHIAAAVGARCVLLFGRTDPAIWAPANEKVTVLRAPAGKLSSLPIETVAAAVSRQSVATS